jgi:hypothetical protein
MNPRDIKTEIQAFHNYIKKITETIDDKNLKNLLTSISYQFSIETRRVYLQELKKFLRKKAHQYFRGKIENNQCILKNFTEQTIVQVFQFFKPDIQGKNIYVLKKLFTFLEERSAPQEERISVFNVNRAEKIFK